MIGYGQKIVDYVWILSDCQRLPITSNDRSVIDYPVLAGGTWAPRSGFAAGPGARTAFPCSGAG